MKQRKTSAHPRPGPSKRHNIPGRRKRRDARNPRKPTGWTRTDFRWSHPDGRTFVLHSLDSWVDRDGESWTGSGHPSRFQPGPF